MTVIVGRFARSEAVFPRKQSQYMASCEWEDDGRVPALLSPAAVLSWLGQCGVGFLLGMTLLAFILGWV